MGAPGTYYPIDENPPIDGVVRPMWRDFVQEKDTQGEWRINRVNYELCVLEAIRDALRCRELWVVDANKYRNPDDDLPKDFEEKREQMKKEDLRALTPLIYSHVTPYGTFRLDLTERIQIEDGQTA